MFFLMKHVGEINPFGSSLISSFHPLVHYSHFQGLTACHFSSPRFSAQHEASGYIKGNHGRVGLYPLEYPQIIPIGKSIGKPWENGGLMGFNGDLASAKILHNELEHHHAIPGKTHELSTGPWLQQRTVRNYQRIEGKAHTHLNITIFSLVMSLNTTILSISKNIKTSHIQYFSPSVPSGDFTQLWKMDHLQVIYLFKQ